MREEIQAGHMVFVSDGQVGIGAVREVLRDSSQIVVNIENGGDFVLPMDVVRDVHSGKVLLDVDKLDAPVREALRHVHEAEDPDYGALNPGEGEAED